MDPYLIYFSFYKCCFVCDRNILCRIQIFRFLYYLVKEVFSSNEGPNPSLKGDNNEIVKVHYQCSKNPLRNPWTSFNKPLHKIYLSEGNSNLFSERSYLSLQNSENALSTLKSLLPQNHWPYFNRTCHKASFGWGKSLFPHFFTRKDNTWKFENVLTSLKRTPGPICTKLDTKHLWVQWILDCLGQGQYISCLEIIIN